MVLVRLGSRSARGFVRGVFRIPRAMAAAGAFSAAVLSAVLIGHLEETRRIAPTEEEPKLGAERVIMRGGGAATMNKGDRVIHKHETDIPSAKDLPPDLVQLMNGFGMDFWHFASVYPALVTAQEVRQYKVAGGEMMVLNPPDWAIHYGFGCIPFDAVLRHRMVELVRVAGRIPEEPAREFGCSVRHIQKWVRQADRDEASREVIWPGTELDDRARRLVPRAEVQHQKES